MTHHTPNCLSSYGMRRTIFIFLGLIVALSVQTVAFTRPVHAYTEQTTVQRVDTKIEYPVSAGTINIAWEAPGRAWFVSPDRDMVGSIVRNSNIEDELISVSINYIALSRRSRPYDVAYANNTVWFVEFGTGNLGRIDLGGGIPTQPTRQYPLPTAGNRPSGVAVAPDGMVWIVVADTALLTRFDPATETFTEFPYSSLVPTGATISTSTTYPDVAVRDSSIVWFTVPGSDMVLAYAPDSDRFSRLFLSNPNREVREPSGVVVDSAGFPWVIARGSNLVGRYVPGTLALWKWFEIPSEDSGPRGIAFQNNGVTWSIWFTEQNSGRLGRLTVTPQFDFISLNEFPQPPDGRPWGIVAGEDSTIWYAESGRGVVAELQEPYASISRLPVLFSSE